MDSAKILSELTVEEKAAIVSGTDFMYTNAIPRLGVPALCMADGPHGLRKQTGEQDNGIAQSEPATSFPTAVTTASSWNPENARRMGAAIGQECRHYGVHVLLGPGANIKRNPLCGRNFEYFSEDPLLSGKMGAAEVQGVQSQGVGVSVKHFAMNNSENYRFMGNSVVDERAMREIYLRSFERIVKEGHPATMMCAYNQINGVFCSENKWLLTDVLRKEWGFDGAVMTDWGAVHERVPGLKAGLDLEMPGDTAICRRWILDGVKDGSLPMEVLDQAVSNILRLVDTYVTGEKAPEADFDTHHALAADIAADS
ncbi:MAG: glycoside hydrolase family 3 N-terminal domain-containing protein, partial [Faecousia sp.]